MNTSNQTKAPKRLVYLVAILGPFGALGRVLSIHDTIKGATDKLEALAEHHGWQSTDEGTYRLDGSTNSEVSVVSEWIHQ